MANVEVIWCMHFICARREMRCVFAWRDWSEESTFYLPWYGACSIYVGGVHLVNSLFIILSIESVTAKGYFRKTKNTSPPLPLPMCVCDLCDDTRRHARRDRAA